MLFYLFFYLRLHHIMTALLTQELAAAGLKESLYRRFKDEPVIVLKFSAALPNFAFCARPSLPASLREQFIQALIRINPRQSCRCRARPGLG